VWAFDLEEDRVDDPLMAAFRHSQVHSSSSPLPTPALLSSSSYPELPTPSTAGFPLTPPPPGLSFGPLDISVTWSNKDRDRDRDISSPLSPSRADVIELVSITPPSPSPVGAGPRDLEPSPVFSLTFSGTKENEEVNLVDFEEEEHVHHGVTDDGKEMLPLVALVEKAQGAQQEVEHDTTVDVHNHWQDWHTEQLAEDDYVHKHWDKDEEEEEDEVSISPASSSSLSRSPSPQYSPPLGMLHSSPLPVPNTNLVDISRSPSPLNMPKPSLVVVVVPPSPIVSWSWDADAHGDENGTGTNDAWGFGEEKVEGSSTDVRDGEDLIQFDGNAVADPDEDRARAGGDAEFDEPTSAGVPSMIPVVEEEAWLVEEPTIVQDVVESRDDIADKYVLLHAEEKEQVLELVFDEDPLLMKTDLATQTVNEVEPLGPQTPVLVHDQPLDDSSPLNDIHEKLRTSAVLTPVLQPLSIPLTLNQEDEEEFPDPDLLPLPPSPPSRKTSLPSMKALAQTPTPPASPPSSPWRLRPLPVSPIQEQDVDLHVDIKSNFSRPASPMSAQASPSTSDTPIAISGAQSPVSTPGSATSTASARPAWSLRAADAPALGIPAQSDDVGVHMIRSSPDMRLRTRSLVEVAENGEDAERDSMELAMKDDISGKQKGKESFPLPAPIKLSTSLPGSFPSPKLITDPLPSSPSQSSAQPTEIAVTTVTLPLAPGPRRRTPRSPLDIALAMQLRPGLGLGADPAWMVRFLMSMFGWFAVLISGRGDFDMYMYAGGVRGGL
jgi:hypothetical protein